MGSSIGYPEVSPGTIAIYSLFECAEHLTKAGGESLAIVSAACSAHRALQAALTAALAGSANIGASPPRLRQRWIAYFETAYTKRSPKTPGLRVMSLRELAIEAATSMLPWSNKPLQISSCESFYLMRLTDYRDDFEHPKQLSYWFTNREVTRAIKYTTYITIRALMEISHQISDQIASIRTLASEISNRCDSVEQDELRRHSK